MMTVRILSAAAAIAFLGASAVPAADLTGSWKGQLTAGDGSSSEVQVDFSPQGYPLYSYTNNRGLTRQVELSEIGQRIEYVPPGGGVQRVIVQTIEQGPGRLSIGLASSFERASGGYMDQQQEAALIEYALVPEGLQMRVTMESTAHFGDQSGMVLGDPNAAVAEGLLQKASQ
jgi:hypothetical protein